MKSSTSLSYAAELVRSLHRDRFLLSLFLPAQYRESLLALYALDAELRHVHGAVTEEVNGHIRYAWWQEALDGIKAGQTPRAHPVVQSIAGMMQSGLLTHEELSAIVMSYRGCFPEMPENTMLVDDVAARLVQNLCPQARGGWDAAHAIITRHREKHGRRWSVLLHLKLMRLGVF